jgi:hypothetical protein
MSGNVSTTASTSKGKPPSIEGGAALPPSDEDIFVLAKRMEELLRGKSNRTCMKVMNMVGSLHGLRCVPSDRPIGQSLTAGVANAKPVKQEKGKPTPPASWKQNPEYRGLLRKREDLVDKIKSYGGRSSPNKERYLESLRSAEAELKAYKSRSSGDH